MFHKEYTIFWDHPGKCYAFKVLILFWAGVCMYFIGINSYVIIGEVDRAFFKIEVRTALLSGATEKALKSGL